MKLSKVLVSILGTALMPAFAAASGVSELCSGSISLSDGRWARYGGRSLLDGI
jgi:hypothetical protein